MEQFTEPVEGQNDGQETATLDAERLGVTIYPEAYDAFCRREEVAGVLRQVDSPYVKAV